MFFKGVRATLVLAVISICVAGTASVSCSNHGDRASEAKIDVTTKREDWSSWALRRVVIASETPVDESGSVGFSIVQPRNSFAPQGIGIYRRLSWAESYENLRIFAAIKTYRDLRLSLHVEGDRDSEGEYGSLDFRIPFQWGSAVVEVKREERLILAECQVPSDVESVLLWLQVEDPQPATSPKLNQNEGVDFAISGLIIVLD